MKMCVTLALSVLTAAVLLTFLPIHGETEIYDAVIRLHVLARSDSADDQAVKLSVRDHVLTVLEPMLADADTVESAEQILRQNMAALESDTAAWLESRGYTVPVRVLLTEETYPTRTYDSFALPAGDYLSLRVVLGDGAGKNWWCVLFPSVCSRFAAADTRQAYLEAGFTPEQYRMITRTEEAPYQIRFRLLELIEAWIGKRD